MDDVGLTLGCSSGIKSAAASNESSKDRVSSPAMSSLFPKSVEGTSKSSWLGALSHSTQSRGVGASRGSVLRSVSGTDPISGPFSMADTWGKRSLIQSTIKLPTAPIQSRTKVNTQTPQSGETNQIPPPIAPINTKLMQKPRTKRRICFNENKVPIPKLKAKRIKPSTLTRRIPTHRAY